MSEEPLEAVILAQAIQGDKDAFSILYKKYVTRIYNYVYYRTGSQFDAEDLTARVFHRALGHIDHYEDKGVPFSAWLYRIAHNLIANWHRDNSRKKEISIDEQIDLLTSGDQPEQTLMHNQETETLLRAIHRLPDDRQFLIILKFMEHLSNAEIAQIMGKSEGAVKSLYHRTLISLRIKLNRISEWKPGQ